LETIGLKVTKLEASDNGVDTNLGGGLQILIIPIYLKQVNLEFHIPNSSGQKRNCEGGDAMRQIYNNILFYKNIK